MLVRQSVYTPFKHRQASFALARINPNLNTSLTLYFTAAENIIEHSLHVEWDEATLFLICQKVLS